MKKAGSLLGFKHSEETKAKLRGAKFFSPEHLLKIKQHISKINSKHTIAVEVSGIEQGTIIEYASIRLTCRELKCADVTVKQYLDTNKLFRNRYIFSCSALKKMINI